MLGGRNPSELTTEQLERIRERAAVIIAQRQRVPMMRVLTHQHMSVIRVGHYNGFQRNRFYR